jgi:hypothetical protein
MYAGSASWFCELSPCVYSVDEPSLMLDSLDDPVASHEPVLPSLHCSLRTAVVTSFMRLTLNGRKLHVVVALCKTLSNVHSLFSRPSALWSPTVSILRFTRRKAT